MNKQEPAGFAKPTIQMFYIAIHLLYAGIVILFLGICYAYVFSDNQFKWDQFHLPKVFWVSTFCVGCISICMHKCLQFYKNDNPKRIFQFLLFAFFLSLLFLLFQFIGWMQMYHAGLTPTGTPGTSYIYVLSALHALHILVGIIFLLVALVRLQKYKKDSVSKLLYLSDPTMRIRLKLLVHYWHTIDLLWVFLFLVFLYQHA